MQVVAGIGNHPHLLVIVVQSTGNELAEAEGRHDIRTRDGHVDHELDVGNDSRDVWR